MSSVRQASSSSSRCRCCACVWVFWREEIVAEDAPRIASKVVIASIQMEGVKESLSFQGAAERLTLGVIRVLGMYYVELATS